MRVGTTRPAVPSERNRCRRSDSFSFERSNDIEFSGERKRVRCNEGLGGTLQPHHDTWGRIEGEIWEREGSLTGADLKTWRPFEFAGRCTQDAALGLNEPGGKQTSIVCRTRIRHAEFPCASVYENDDSGLR